MASLRARRIGPWGLAYLAGAAVVIEVADVLGGSFGWPAPVLRGLIGAVAVGFFVALILAWFHGRSGRQRVTGLEALLLTGILGPGVLVVTALAMTGSSFPPSAELAEPTPEGGNSIAVLPFINHGLGDASPLLTDGVHDLIIVQLSKIAGLRVLSSASVMTSVEKGASSREIASELGAGYTIEGRIRREGDRIRIDVELVEASSGENRWAESYETAYGARELFQIQSDLAVSVATALRATLTDRERSSLAAVPTRDIEALERYAEGIALRNRAISATTLERALLRFRDAVAADPGFLDAWTDLAETQLYIYHNIDGSGDRLEAAREALARASALDPAAPRVRMVKGLYHYRVESDFPRALGEFLIAQRGLPSDPEILKNTGLVQRRMGLTGDAAETFQAALRLDPQDANLNVDLALTLLLLRRFEASGAAYERALELDPENDWAIAGLALARLPIDPEEARRLLGSHLANSDYASDWAWGLVAAALGEHELWRHRVDLLERNELVHQAALHPRTLVRAWTEDALGNRTAARANYDSAAAHLSSRLQEAPGDGRAMAALGLALAGLGRGEEAAHLGRRALEVAPFDRDQYLAGILREDLAKIYAMSGEADLALAEIETLLARPGYLTRARLAGDWIWRDIRDDPRFGRLTSER